MRIELQPGFQGKIIVENSKKKSLYEQDCTSEKEVAEFLKTYSKSKPGWSVMNGVFYPLRTDKLSDFTKDLFLPTFVNHALEINNIALRIFASLFAIAFDLSTLPIRFLATPFRVFYNYRHPEETHPLSTLIEKESDQTPFRENYVTIKYETSNVKMNEPIEKEGHVFQNASQETTDGTTFVALKSQVGGIKSNFTELRVNRDYNRIDDEWDSSGSVTTKSHRSSFTCS